MELRPDGLDDLPAQPRDRPAGEPRATSRAWCSRPRFSPDGGKVAFSVERGGNSDIFVMDLQNRATARLTADPAIDTSPSFSPDGARIVFNSDRSGSPQLYVMGADGSNPRRITFGRAATPRRSGARPASSSPSPSRPAASSTSG